LGQHLSVIEAQNGKTGLAHYRRSARVPNLALGLEMLTAV
jgi:hypothetical protein